MRLPWDGFASFSVWRLFFSAAALLGPCHCQCNASNGTLFVRSFIFCLRSLAPTPPPFLPRPRRPCARCRCRASGYGSIRFHSFQSPLSSIVAGRTAIPFAFLFPLSALLYLRVAYLYCTRVYISPSARLVKGRQSSPLCPSFTLHAFILNRLLDGKPNYRAEVNACRYGGSQCGVWAWSNGPRLRGIEVRIKGFK